MRLGEPHLRPRPRHDPVHVVAAPAGGEPAPTGMQVRQRIDEPGSSPHRRRRDQQVRERVERVRIRAVLGHDDLGPKRFGQWRQNDLQRLDPADLAGPRVERDVDLGALGAGTAELIRKARAGEQREAALVDRNCQHARVRPVNRLDAVAVVHVQVDVHDPQAVAARPRDRERRVVVHAKARGPRRHRVVQPAAGVEGMGHLAAEDRLDGPQRAAGDRGGRLVHAGERGRVARPDPHPSRSGRRRAAALDMLDVRRVMHPRELLVGGRLGSEIRHGPERLQERDARPEPARRQRMRRPEVIRGRARSVDQEGLRRSRVGGVWHAGHDTRAMPGVPSAA